MTTQGQPASAPAQQSAAPQPAQQPAQAPSQQVATRAPADDGFGELRKFAAAGAERMGRAMTDSVQGPEGVGEQQSEPELTLPAGLVNNQFANQQAQQAQQVAQTQQNPQVQATQTQQQQEGAETQQPGTEAQDTAEQQAREISKIVLHNAQGQPMEFEHDQLVNILQGYHHYQSNIQNIQNDFNQRYQQLEGVRQQVLADQARIDSLLKSEKGFILEALESNQEFADKVADLISEHPELFQNYQSRKVDTVANQGNQKITELEQQIQQLRQQQQQQQLEQQQRQQQTYINNTVDTVKANVARLNQQFQVPAKTIDALTAQAVLEVQTGRLPFNAQTVTSWFENQLRAISQDLASIKNQVRGEYINQKQSAPPPPPTGGGAPTPINTAEMTPRERTRFVANQLSQMGNGSLR
jgi:hypothetical protein